MREEQTKHFFEFTIISAFPTSLTSVCFAWEFKTSRAEFLKKFKEERRVDAFVGSTVLGLCENRKTGLNLNFGCWHWQHEVRLFLMLAVPFFFLLFDYIRSGKPSYFQTWSSLCVVSCSMKRKAHAERVKQPLHLKKERKKKVHIFSLFLKPNRLSRLIDQRGIWTWNMQCEELYTLIAKWVNYHIYNRFWDDFLFELFCSLFMMSWKGFFFKCYFDHMLQCLRSAVIMLIFTSKTITRCAIFVEHITVCTSCWCL